MKIARHGFPVCGFPDFETVDDAGCLTYFICLSCGCEAGYEYQEEVNDEDLVDIRRHWLFIEKGKWWSDAQKPPEGWNAIAQMKNAGIPIPSEKSA